jgi:hypothetical protein
LFGLEPAVETRQVFLLWIILFLFGISQWKEPKGSVIVTPAPPSRLKPKMEQQKVVVFLRERKQGAGHKLLHIDTCDLSGDTRVQSAFVPAGSQPHEIRTSLPRLKCID